MVKYIGLNKEAGHKPRNKTGILLLNLGTPDAPTTSAVRRYLAEFLSDQRVIEIPKLIWKTILHGIILRVRPAKSAELYKSVWTDEGSPLLVITQKQTAALKATLMAEGINAEVEFAMRYGQPAVGDVMRKMHEAGVDKFIILPLYPQYSAPTTGSVFDAIAAELTQWRYLPELHFINTYHEHPAFIEALADSIAADFEKNGKPQKLVMSYHGMPEKNLLSGDPYYCFCIKTTQLVMERLGLSSDEVMSTFQSRFGNAKWLTPYTDETMESLPKQGITDIAVISPAFSADCLETLEEIAVENRHFFEEAGGKSYRYIEALNDNPKHIDMMAQLVKPYLD